MNLNSQMWPIDSKAIVQRHVCQQRHHQGFCSSAYKQHWLVVCAGWSPEPGQEAAGKSKTAPESAVPVRKKRKIRSARSIPLIITQTAVMIRWLISCLFRCMQCMVDCHMQLEAHAQQVNVSMHMHKTVRAGLSGSRSSWRVLRSSRCRVEAHTRLVVLLSPRPATLSWLPPSKH